MSKFRIPLQRIAFGMTVITSVAFVGATGDADDHSVAEEVSPNLYRLSSSVSVLTSGCSQDGGKVRIDRRRQTIAFVSDGAKVAECSIETWVAPVSEELLSGTRS